MLKFKKNNYSYLYIFFLLLVFFFNEFSTNYALGKNYNVPDVKVEESYDIDFWLMNLIEPDYNRLLKEVRGKKVFFNASNIFSYNKVILKYSLTEVKRDCIIFCDRSPSTTSRNI